MSDVPRWLRWSAGVTVGALLIALARPPVAGLVLRALVVIVAAVLVILAVATAVHGLEPAEGLARRPDPREPGDVPRELAILTEDLRATSRRGNVPISALRTLRASLQHRLWYHHGLSTVTPEHDGTIRGRVSPAAYALLQSARAKQEYPAIPAVDLPALIQEVERL